MFLQAGKVCGRAIKASLSITCACVFLLPLTWEAHDLTIAVNPQNAILKVLVKLVFMDLFLMEGQMLKQVTLGS
jgi:hypothetical protein